MGMTAARPEDRYALVEGISTRYWQAGKFGKPLLLIHGFGGSVETDWSRNILPMAARNRVYALDLAGCGLSGKPRDFEYSLSGYAMFVKGFMEAIALERAAVIGFSMGGGIALRFALLCPEKVEKLVLVDCLGLGREVHPMYKALSLPVLGRLLSRPSLRKSASNRRRLVRDRSAIAAELAARDYAFATGPGARRALLAMMRNCCNLGGIKKSVTRPILSRIDTIRSPTLVVWGREDPVFPLIHARLAQEMIPGAILHIFEGCGHCPQLERAEAFNDLVADFVAG